MLESVDTADEESGKGEESDRIDALLSSALADQARERRTLVETVFGAKSALVKAEEELAGIRELINQRDNELLEAIARNNQTIVESISTNLLDAVLTQRIEAIEEAILQLAQRIAGLGELPVQLRRDLEVSAVAIGERIGEESASLLADIREDQVEVVQTLVSMSEAELKELKQAINSAKQEVTERTASTGRDTVEAGRTTVEQMVEYLTGYLQERDEQLYRARDKRLIELFQQLSDTIGRSTKRKLTKALGDDYSTPQPLSPPEPPANKPPSLSIPRTFRSPAPGEAPPPDRPGQSFQDLQPVRPPDRPDPAFASGEPPVRAFDPIDDDPFNAPPAPYRPSGSFGAAARRSNEPYSPTRAMANPLSRAELVRDYLVDSPEEMFLNNPPAVPTPKGRRKPRKSEDPPPAQPRSGTPTGRPPKSPANPRTRRKP
ncbi:hypothetical protein BH23ACT12_BH23ACT12_13120 [soil metagenome]